VADRDLVSLHTEVDARNTLNEMLDEAAQHWRNSIRTNLGILREIVETVQNFLNEHGEDVWASTQLVCLAYRLLFRRSRGLPMGELRAENEGSPRIVYVSEDETSGSLASGRIVDSESLAGLAAKLNELINSDSEHRRLSYALDEARASDELVVKLLSRIRDLVEKWRTQGLAGECEICRDVMPKSSSWQLRSAC
jgi:hypothetical protein